MSPDVNDPAFRAVTFDQLKQTYFDQAKALLEGDVDLLLVETIFDTLNAKAALFAIAEVFEQTGKKVPLMISGTVTDRSGRTLSGQTVEAFLISIAHAQPLIVGLNCALGPDEMEPYVEELARISPYFMSAYPNAGLPDPLSETGFPETPKTFTPKVAKWAENGWLNLVGGCCGTTPEHIRAIAQTVRDCKPRQIQSAIHNPQSAVLRLSGLEPLNITPEFGFAVIPNGIDSAKWNVIEAGLQCVQGKAVVNSISLKNGEEEFLRQAQLIRLYGAAVIVMAFDERGQADSLDRKIEICSRAYKLLT